MIKNPKVSVVLTVYNGSPFIKEAIDSILQQRFDDFEFIIVDNASTDNTISIIREYRDPRIVLIQNSENLGQTKALNIGITVSRADFIARIDADDIAYPERLEEQYSLIIKDKTIAVVGSWHEDIDERGRSLRIFKVPTNHLEVKMYLIASGNLAYYCCVSHPTVMMRKSALYEVGLYNEKYYLQDLDLWLRISSRFKIVNLNKALLKHRVYGGSLSHTNQERIGLELDEIIAGFIRSKSSSISEDDGLCLKKMLKFETQPSPAAGNKVLSIFDNFFDSVAGNELNNPMIPKIRNRIKMYYLPRLFLTNRLLAIKTARDIVMRQPAILMDGKFYRKIAKSFEVH